MYLARGLESRVIAALQTRPVVILEGARGVGKTRLARQLIETGVLGGDYFTFNDETTQQLAQSSPKAFVDELPFGSVVDEAQMVPEIQLQLKRLVDADSAPGRVLLTGSVRIAKDQLGGSAPLAGRSNTLRLEPFTRSERQGKPRSVLAALCAGDPRSLDFTAETQSTILQEAVGGGFPLLTSAADRQNFIEEALPGAVVGRRDRNAVLDFGRQLASGTAKPFVADRLGREMQLDYRTIAEYADLWEDVMLVRRLTNWRPSPRSAAKAQPKLHVVDIGLATAWGGLNLDGDRGALFETLVANELIAQTWANPDVTVFHYRESSKYEIDLILGQISSPDLVGVEVKAASEVRPKDFKQFTDFQSRHDDRLKHGYVFYTGDKIVKFDEGLWAVPIPALWGPGSVAVAVESVDLRGAVAGMAAAIRTKGNPSLLASRLPAVEMPLELAVDELAEVLREAANELGLRLAKGKGRLRGNTTMGAGRFSAARFLKFTGTATTREVGLNVVATAEPSDIVHLLVELVSRSNNRVGWQLDADADREVEEADYAADTISELALTLMPHLTAALGEL